jgi:Cu(I)/Ag(I) efflux system membrane fusion protein
MRRAPRSYRPASAGSCAAPLTPGDPVEAGREVALIYSDTLEGLEREYLATRTADPDLAAPLRSRLLAGGLDEPGLRHIESTGRADGLVAARALAGGTVTRRLVRVGAVVAPGAPLLELSSTQAPWLEARIAEPDLAGLPAQLRGSARLFAWASPVAVELERLLPGTPETVAGGGAAGPAAGMGTAMERSPAVVVPTTSVIRAGHRAVVFVAVSGDVFVPREVRLGVAAGERVEVAEGVGAGEVVVASGTFLVAAESRLQASDTFWRAGLPEGSGVTP